MSLDQTLFLLRLVQAILAVALLALVGQGVLWALVRAFGQDPANNLFYRLLETVVKPFTWTLRRVTPRFVADRHIPWAVLGLLVVAYAWTMFAIANACISHGMAVAECLRGR